MGGPRKPLDRDGSPVREFAFWLRDLRRHSGLTYDQLGRKSRYATSTVQSAAAGKRLPTLKVTLAFVRACEADLRQWRGGRGRGRQPVARGGRPPRAQAGAAAG